MEVEIEAPSHFLCPISMQLMKDPVTISTGITYDRENIEKWLFTCQTTTCPVTKQSLSVTDLTPNHTLRRLIQSWCITNSHHDWINNRTPSTPMKPLEYKCRLKKLLKDAKTHPHNEIEFLRRMRSIAQSSDRGKTCMDEDLGCLVEFLMTVVMKETENGSVSEACDEALNVLNHLQFTDLQLRNHVRGNESRFVNAITHVMRFGNIHSRSHAIMMLRSVFKTMDPTRIAGVTPELFNETVRILKENVCKQTIKASLEVVVEIVRWGRNRIKAAESGMVSVIVELLINNTDHRVCELMLVALEKICRCAEGRAKLVEHAAGLATVSKKILRVSHVGSEKAVRILCLVCRFSASFRVLQEMVEMGVVSKLCLMIQVDCSEKTKERVKQILTLHSRVWKGASCIPAHLLSSYPSF